MRANIYLSHVKIYNEEQTGRVEPCADPANDGAVVFKGIRFFFGRKANHTPEDDDTSAVTFYFTDEDNGYWKNQLRTALQKALELLDNDSAFNEQVAAANVIAAAIRRGTGN
jgi:hypothetical protein